MATEEDAEYGVSDEALKRLDTEMKDAAKKLGFERAAVIRDKIKEVRKKMLETEVKGS